jgi:hypothetical protein
MYCTLIFPTNGIRALKGQINTNIWENERIRDMPIIIRIFFSFQMYMSKTEGLHLWAGIPGNCDGAKIQGLTFNRFFKPRATFLQRWNSLTSYM